MTASATAAIDTADMHGAIGSLPTQLRKGYESAIGQVRDIDSRQPRALVICGMGGSGVGGDLLASTAIAHAPIVGVKEYDLPAWVGAQDVVVCTSYSGGTAETLSCADQARERGARIIAITSGGLLAQRAEQWRVPIVFVEGGMQPRAAVGHLFSALAVVADRIETVDAADRLIEQAAAGAQRVVERHADLGDETAPALQLAMSLEGTLVIVYGAGATGAIAGRWKAQINENAKLPAYSNTYPELDHNEIVGWEHARATGARWSVVELVGAGERAENVERMRVTMSLVADSVDRHHRIDAGSKSVAGSAFELLALGDYVSLHLALLRGVDPSPVERIAELKQRLAGR